MLISKPVDPLVEIDSTYGKVYHLGSPADLMEMTERENALIFMPHPRSKGSTGFPDAVKDKPYFQHENYPRTGVSLGHGHRRLRKAFVRISVPGPVG
jgi:hypothetical protein